MKNRVDDRQQHLSSIQDSIENYFEWMQSEEGISTGNAKGLRFKPSIAKEDIKLEFLPTNLHLQHMKVYDCGHSKQPECVGEESGEQGYIVPSTRPLAIYQNVTGGVAAAHTMKFKNGRGLRTLKKRFQQKMID